MPDTLSNIPLPAGQWVDLYAATGITRGQPLIVENVGYCDVSVTVSATEPPRNYDAYSVLKRDSDVHFSNTLGDSGAWAYCNNMDGLVNVSVQGGFQPYLRIDGREGVGAGINLDAWSRQKAVHDFSLFDGLFTFGISETRFLIYENDVEVPSASSTRAVANNGFLKILSGVNPGDTVEVHSKRHPRYQPNRGLLYSASLGFKDASKDGIVEVGLFTGRENGAYFKTKGDGKLYACIRSLGVETHEDEIIFPFNIDITKGNLFDIQIEWRGTGNYKWYAGNPASGVLERVHTTKILNTLDEAVSISNPSLSAAFYAENVTQEVTAWCGCVNVSSEGGRPSRLQYVSADISKTVSATDGIIAIRSPALVGGKINTRDAELLRMIITADKKSTVKAYRTRNPAAIVGGVWTQIRSYSYLEENSTMLLVNTGLMEEFATFKLQTLQTLYLDSPDKDRIEISVTHGDYIVLVCDTGVIVQVDATIELGEEA